MSCTTNTISSNEKNRKINWFNLKKIVLGTIRGDEFLYISYKLITNLISNCYSISLLISRSPPPRIFTLIYTISSFSSLSYTWTIDCLCWSLSHQHLPEIFGGSCKAESYYSGITSTLMRPGVRCRAFNVVVATFFSDISQLSFILSFPDVCPYEHDCLLPSTWWVVGLLAFTLLAEEVMFLGQCPLLIITWSLPRPNICLPSLVPVCPRVIWRSQARPTAQYLYLGPSSLQ